VRGEFCRRKKKKKASSGREKQTGKVSLRRQLADGCLLEKGSGTNKEGSPSVVRDHQSDFGREKKLGLESGGAGCPS